MWPPHMLKPIRWGAKQSAMETCGALPHRICLPPSGHGWSCSGSVSGSCILPEPFAARSTSAGYLHVNGTEISDKPLEGQIGRGHQRTEDTEGGGTPSYRYCLAQCISVREASVATRDQGITRAWAVASVGEEKQNKQLDTTNTDHPCDTVKSLSALFKLWDALFPK